jgi:hypothetical protein
MFTLTTLLPFLLLTSSSALPTLEQRAATTCGTHSYTAAQVNSAAQKACADFQAGITADTYPHTYNNFEGFSFTVAGPYQEFPLLASGSVYTGG